MITLTTNFAFQNEDHILANLKQKETNYQASKEAFLKSHPKAQYFAVDTFSLNELLRNVLQNPDNYTFTPEAKYFIEHQEVRSMVMAQLDFITGTKRVLRISKEEYEKLYRNDALVI